MQGLKLHVSKLKLNKRLQANSKQQTQAGHNLLVTAPYLSFKVLTETAQNRITLYLSSAEDG